MMHKFKQGNTGVTLPDATTEQRLWILVLVAGLGKLLTLIDLIYAQTHATVFFIDWERSKYGFCHCFINFLRGKLRDRGNEKGTSVPVSVWRSLFIANQWNQMQVFYYKIK